MKLWMSLYAMIWIVLVEFLLAMTPASGGVRVALGYVHIALGIAIAGLAYHNFDGLRRTKVPGRVKRTAKATFQISIMMAITGVLLALRVGTDLVIPLISLSLFAVILFVHVFNAFAVITQSAAVAIAHDMWEDHEFTAETEVGIVPAHPLASDARKPAPHESE